MTPTQRDTLCDAILGSPGDAIVLCDREGVILFWNPGAERIFGFTASEALGRSLDIIIPEPQRARHWQGFQRVMESGLSRYGEGDILAVPALHRDGRRVSVEFTIMPMRDSDGVLNGMAAILRDVSIRFEEMRSLRRQLAAASGTGSARETR